MTPEPLVLALDIGTSSTRAILFDAAGSKVGEEAQHAYDQTTTPDGGVETDAEALLELTARCIDDILKGTDRPILAAGASCFWHSLLGVDAQGKPLTGVLSWADNRSAAWVSPLRSMLKERETHARTGAMFHTSYWPAKLLWLQHARPELFEGGMRWMSFAEFFTLRVCGEAIASISMASGTGIFSQVPCEWDRPILDILQIETSQLSRLVDSSEALPPLLPEFASRWPALAQSKWYPALGDGACSNIGSGCVTPDRIAMNVGTSGALRVVLENYTAPAPRGLWRYRIDKKRSVMGGAVSNAGNVWKWANSTLKLPADFDAQMTAMAPDSHGLTVLPFLAGERSPLWNANARMVIEGATLDTTAVKMLRAALEASSLRFAEVAEAVRSAVAEYRKEHGGANSEEGEIVASGGALERSACWTQIMCDCLGVPLVESRETEASARGAALMALEASGAIGNIADIPAERGGVVQPNAAKPPQIYPRARTPKRAL